MAISPNNTIDIQDVHTINPVGGTPTGSRVSAPSPYRGRVIEVGFMPCSLVASAVTLAVSVSNNTVSSTASNFSQIVTSTLGTFSSTVMFEGAVCSVIPPSPAFVNQGDAIQWTTSGGNTSAIGLTLYAIIKRG